MTVLTQLRCALALVAVALVGAAPFINDEWRTGENRKMYSEWGLKGRFLSSGGMSIYVSRADHNKVKMRADATGKKEGWPVSIICHHEWGIWNHPFIRRYADKVADLGQIAMVPDFYHRVWSPEFPTGINASKALIRTEDMKQTLKDWEIMKDFFTTIEAMEERAKKWRANTERIAVIGFNIGARMAWIAALSKELENRLTALVGYGPPDLLECWPKTTKKVKVARRKYKFDCEGEDAPIERMGKAHTPSIGHFALLDENPKLDPHNYKVDLRMQLETALHPANINAENFVYNKAKNCFACEDHENYRHQDAEIAWDRTWDYLKSMQSRDPEGPIWHLDPDAPRYVRASEREQEL